MALWEEFGKKAGETARNFGARAKEVAETTKLNGQIAIKKTEAERLYAEIGKTFFAIRAGRSQENDELEQLCKRVEQLDAEIVSVQKQLDIIHQVRRCKNCGEVCANTARFCGACGSKFEEETVKEPEKPAEETVETEEGVEITWPQAEEKSAEEKNEQE